MRAALLAVLVLAACGGDDSSSSADAAPPSADAPLGDAPSTDAPPAAKDGTKTLDACAALGLGSEPCSYTFEYDPAMCAGRACKRLVIYFSGGQETCPDPSSQISNLAYYRARGYVAVCARDFVTGDGSGQFPRHAEAPRVDALVHAITSDPDILAGWSGEYLLLSGVSHGASGPPIAMATSTFDDAPAWHGSAYTGACFFDGTYDAPALLDFLYTNQCTTLTSDLPYARAYGRYCPFGGNGNQPATWPLPSTCATADTAADTITQVAPEELAIHDWKLVECGSALAACSGGLANQDVLPAASIQALCADIAGGAAAGYTCELGSFPSTSHVACGIDATTIGVCDDWFEAQLASHGLP
jgi:hypothetical protein